MTYAAKRDAAILLRNMAKQRENGRRHRSQEKPEWSYETSSKQTMEARMALADVIKTALDQMQYIAKTETVIGEPITAGNVTLIPVSRVSIGFAAGGAGKDDKCATGAGTGGGISITPVAFISVIDDRVQVHPVSHEDPFLSWVMEQAPEAVKKVSALFKKKENKEKTEGTPL